MRIIIKKSQLNEYIERKKAEKVVSSILEEMHKNSKFLSEHISLIKANQTIIDKYRTQKLITPRVENMLKEFSIINESGQIL